MSGETSLLPALRFDSFDEEWKVARFEDELIESKLGGNYANSEEPTDHPLIKMGNLGRGDMNLNKLEYIHDGETVNPDDRMKDGDLFFNTRNTLELVGKVAIWRSELPEAYYNSNLMRIGFACNHFMNYRLNSFGGIKALRRLATGTTSVAAIYTRDLLKMKITVAPLPEQRKIADFLTAVDKRIGQLIQKKALLADYKKGVMQQLFSQAIRFKDDHGNDFPDWEDKKLGDYITSLDAGVSVNSEDIPVSGDELGILKTSCVSRGYFDPHENKRVVDSMERNRLKSAVTKNTIVISRMNTSALVGLSGLVTVNNPNLFLPDRLWAATISKSASPQFVAHLLASPKMRALISARATGTSGSMKNITKGDVRSLPFEAPTLDEQTKIADFLSAIDRKIESVATQITETQTFKRGLLQQMFV